MKYSFLGIDEQRIVGIKNPKFILKGTVVLEDYHFILKIDGKEEEFKLESNGTRFFIEKILSRKDKRIQVFLQSKKEEYLICDTKNMVLRRIKAKGKEKWINFINYKVIRIIRYIFYTLYKGIRLAWREHHFLIPPSLWPKYIEAIKVKLKGGEDALYYNPFNAKEYNQWIRENNQEEPIEEFSYNPLISIAIPVYNIEREFLKDCLDSILNQQYPNFEVCLADDASTKKETIDTLKEYEKKDKRIRVVYRKENGHISKATNSAIEIAKGEFVALMDDDDVIPENALYEVVKVLNQDKTLDMIYTDEDKMEMDGTLCDPHFKPDFSPDTLLGGNYICHFSFFRRTILEKIGGFRSEFVGAQDFDLVLRFTEETKKIYHLPKVLYHWRKVPGSTAVTIDSKGYAIENGRKAVEEALKRRKEKGTVTAPINAAHYVVEYEVENNPKVSIIIPTKDNAKILNQCLKSIYEKATYKNFEIIVVDNKSEKKETKDLLENYKKKHKNFKVMKANYEFNYSKINNEAVKKASGDYILLLNNDTEVITQNFIEIMLGYASRKHIGAVGAKLLYPDGTIQHGGIILGIGGIAAHAYPEVEASNYGTFGRLLIPYNYSGVTAACLMIDKKKYEEVNGLEEELKVAYNDVDFNMKLLEKGYYNIFLPQVTLMHFESKTRGLDTTTEKFKRLQEETEYMKNKWKEKLTRDRFYNPNYSLGRDFRLDKKKK